MSSCSGAPEAKSCFATPLILGASVSAGYGTNRGGTSEIIAKEIHPEAVISNRAKSGATSLQSLKDLNLHTVNPSVVLALDLFFWDAARNQCGENFISHTTKFFRSFEGTPLIVGKIPVDVSFPDGYRLAGARPCTKVVNALIEKLCKIEANCLIYDPKECLNQMSSPEDYFLDKLHPNDKGNEFCTKKFIESARYKSLTCA